MGETTKTSPDGLAELAIGMVDLAKDDYIRGALILIKRFARPMDILVKYPPAKMVIERSRPGASASADRKVYWYKDTLRFVNEDPFGFFADPDEVIKAWNDEAWERYRKKFS